MSKARFHIGIDLGTSNCAVAYIDTQATNPKTAVFSIPQQDSIDTRSAFNTLPSFLFPQEPEIKTSDDWKPTYITGMYARKKSAETPDQVVHSAKSWLCHRGIDRRSKLLPWHSKAVKEEHKLSPIQASSAYLDYIQYAWDQVMARGDNSALFANQEVVVTVPASFDNVAQKLTLEASKMANFPSNVTLLEEPQAAIYCYLENNGGSQKILELLPQLRSHPQTILVCDIGGGTSDFSLMEALPPEEASEKVALRRIAVSDHILLGGDNVDITLAKHLELKLQEQGHSITHQEWNYLIAQARNIKESALTDYDNEKLDESYPVSIVSGGSQLFSQAKSASLNGREVIAIIENGFFPNCESQAVPEQQNAGLIEIGLPYAKDSAITHHLAHFLNDRKVDAILFNGGTVSSHKIQSRVCNIISTWQDGQAPLLLDNPIPYLAVAHGASYYCWQSRTGIGNLIEAGAARSVYLQIDKKETKTSKKKKKKGLLSDAPYLVCILPFGSKNDETIILERNRFDLRLNQPVQFQPYYSTHREEDNAGDLVQMNEQDFQEMSPLQTLINTAGEKEFKDVETTKVVIESRLNAIGLLQVFCKSVDESSLQGKEWELEFNLRSLATNPENSADKLEVSDEAYNRAHAITTGIFPPSGKKADHTLKATGLIKQWEEALEIKKKAWDTPLLRNLWDQLASEISQRYRSLDHEISWVIAAGYTMRPGYGFIGDEKRMEDLWLLKDLGLHYPTDKQVKEQEMILWRRTAGGLSTEKQEMLIKEFLPFLRELTNLALEGFRMAASLERISREDRIEILDLCYEALKTKNEKFHDAYLWSIGRLLSRIPLYSGMHTVLPPQQVEKAFEFFKDWDWENEKTANALCSLFAQAARITNQREIDVTDNLRSQIIEKMEIANASNQQIEPLREFILIAREDLSILYGEALPAGLSI
jgi:molecular chaperone DnaK (HSP70)